MRIQVSAAGRGKSAYDCRVAARKLTLTADAEIPGDKFLLAAIYRAFWGPDRDTPRRKKIRDAVVAEAKCLLKEYGRKEEAK